MCGMCVCARMSTRARVYQAGKDSSGNLACRLLWGAGGGRLVCRASPALAEAGQAPSPEMLYSRARAASAPEAPGCPRKRGLRG